jgi:serine protease
LIDRLQRGARTFPAPLVDSSGAALPTCHTPASAADIQDTECVCTTAVCGAGVLDAAGAIQEALRPIASIRASGTVSAGASVIVDAGASSAACGRTLASYAWTAVDANGQPVALTSTNQSSTSLNAPASGSVTLTLVITDSSGATDSGSVQLTATSVGQFGPAVTSTPVCPQAITVMPASTGGTTPAAKSSGGGGSLDLWMLLYGGAVAMRRRSRGHRLQWRA